MLSKPTASGRCEDLRQSQRRNWTQVLGDKKAIQLVNTELEKAATIETHREQDRP
jgi:hypothetical protein